MLQPLLLERFPVLARTLPHVSLGRAPAPVRELSAISDEGAAPVWLKDDSVYGEGGWGGNKVRKLEWILADVERSGRRTLVTFGAIGTNHGLATAVYGRARGIRVVLVLLDQPHNARVAERFEVLRRVAAQTYYTRGKARTVAALPLILAREAAIDRRRPYVLGVGGSSPVGALGYVEAGLELAGQVERGDLPEPSHVVVALGSGGTAAGLALGLAIAGLRSRVVAVLVNDQMRLDGKVLARLARRTAGLLREHGAALPVGPPTARDLTIETGFVGSGYGHGTSEAESAMRLARERAGLELEPVYTGKAMAGLIELNRRGAFGSGPVLFVNTHGPRDL